MAIYHVTATNWNSPVFWASVDQAGAGHTLDFSALSADYRVDLDGDAGLLTIDHSGTSFTVSDSTTSGGQDAALGGNTQFAFFSIQHGGEGDDILSVGNGADSVDGGAGDDVIDLGAADGASDTVVLRNGSNNDIVLNFEAPTPNGDGTFTGTDTLDVSNLLAPSGAPVTTVDVNVANDGSGNAFLLFHGGVTVTLMGISSADADNIYFLNALGIPLPLNHIVEGDDGDNLIDSTYLDDPQGDRIDNADHSDGSQDDVVEAGGGNDTVRAGDGNDYVEGQEGNDSIEGGIGHDTIQAGLDHDTVLGGAGNDLVHGSHGNDSLIGGAGSDSLYGEYGRDYVEGGAGDDTLEGNEGQDTLIGGAGNDWMRGSYDADSLRGGTGDDYLWGGFGDDTFHIENNFGNDTVAGEDVEETHGDLLDFSSVTDDLRFDLTNSYAKAGTVSDGTYTLQYNEVELIELGSGTDTLVLADSSGSDRVQGFRPPTDNGDGTFTGHDKLDVSALHGWSGDPVTTADVTVSDSIGDGTGDAVLTFPNGENLTLAGVSVSEVQSPAQLVAIGIPSSGSDSIVSGTSGDDLIDGTYLGDPDGDRIDHADGVGGTDVDTVSAGDGDDTVRAGDGADQIFGGIGDDLLEGQGGADTLIGGEGSDTLIGGADADQLVGGAGDDRFELGSGDTADGGDGDDFFAVGPEDLDGGSLTVTGGEGGESDGDTLHITGPATIAKTGAESGTVIWMDGSRLDFSQIEKVHYTPCFTPGTLIKTLDGERDAADLVQGDIVLTRDNGYQSVRWAGRKELSAAELLATPALRPVRIAKGALGPSTPERDMIVSPQHRVVMSGYAIELLFGEDEVLVAATHLVGRPGVTRLCPDKGVTYVHFMFDHHELVMSDGAWTESFQPGDMSLAGLDQDQRDEVLGLFPELSEKSGRTSYGAARMSLKSHQARVLANV